MLTGLQEQYQCYIQKSRKIREQASPLAGLFGMGDDPKNHPCHEEFYEAVGVWTEALIRSDPTPAEAMRAAEWIISAAADHRGEDCFWWLFAAQGHVGGLVPYLSPEDCRELVEWYGQHYSRREMLPVQEKLVKHLKKQAKR